MRMTITVCSALKLHLLEKIIMSNLELLKLMSRTLFNSGIQSVLPHALIRKYVHREGSNLTVLGKRYVLQKNCYLVGFGKAVLAMSSELERILGEHLISGEISVPDGILTTFRHYKEMLPKPNSVLKVIEGARNNLPDVKAEKAALSIMNLLKNLDSNAILFVTVSGGGSALLPSPVPPITLAEKLAVTKLLSHAGANINELNSVRKSLSILKGGGLAEVAYPAQIIALILSDIIDDPLDSIASGPTVLSTDTNQTTLNILKKYALEEHIPSSVWDYIKRTSEKKITSSDVPVHNGQFSHVYNCLIGNNINALESVAERAKVEGYYPIILSSSVEGNVRQVAKVYSNFAVEISKFICGQHTSESLLKTMKNICKSLGIPLKNLINIKVLDFPIGCKRICLISGGETTVEVKGNGLGGRNQELSLAFAIEASDITKKCAFCEQCDILFLSGGTDGIDGPTNYAGAISYPQQINLALSCGINPLEYLNNNDSTNFYLNLNNGEDLLLTGHTGTNVMDVHMLIVEGKNNFC